MLVVFLVTYMIKLVVKFVLQVLEDSRQILVAANMQPDDPFPMDDKIKEGKEIYLFSHCTNISTVCPPSQPASPLPVSFLISTAYSHVVENTAFFGDVALRFPRIVHHYYDRNSDWGGLLRWGLNFCNQTGVFTGGAHQHVLTLVRACDKLPVSVLTTCRELSKCIFSASAVERKRILASNAGCQSPDLTC